MNQNAQPAKLISPIVDYFLRNNMARNYTDIKGELSELVTLNFPTQNYQQAYYFAPQTMLDGDNSIITAISVVGNTLEPGSPGGLLNLPSGQQNFPGEYFNYGVLYISNLRREIIAELPLWNLNPNNNNGKPFFTYFEDVLWQNCYVKFTTTAFTSAIRPIAFQVYYTPRIQDGQK